MGVVERKIVQVVCDTPGCGNFYSEFGTRYIVIDLCRKSGWSVGTKVTCAECKQRKTKQK